MRQLHPAWTEHPVRTSLRYCVSALRQRLPLFNSAVVPYDDARSRLHVDLTTALGLGLYRYRELDPEVAWVGSLLEPGDVFVDGGANVGLYSLMAAARVGPTGKVIAFEPAAATRDRLIRNVRLSRFWHVQVRPDALSDHPGETELVVFDRDGAGLSSFAPSSTSGGRRERVPLTTLDEALSTSDTARLRVIKLDLEGAELAALRGARRVLAESSADVFLEVEPAHLERQGASASAIFGVLRELGHELFRIAVGEDRRPRLSRLGVEEQLGWRGGNVFATRRHELIAARQLGVARSHAPS